MQILLALQNYYITTFYSIFHKNNIKFIGNNHKQNKHIANIGRYKEFPYQRDEK